MVSKQSVLLLCGYNLLRPCFCSYFDPETTPMRS